MKRALSFLSLLFLLLLPLSVAASETTGSLSGLIVSAEDGQALPGATVKVESAALMGKRFTTADSEGKFRLVFLPPGAYTVTVSLMGFATTTQTDVKISLGRNVAMEFQLQPSALEETVEIRGTAPLIDTTTTTIGGNITNEEFERLPVSRSYQDLAALIPGVDNDMSDYDPTQLKNSPTIAGSSAPENNYVIDGISTTDALFGTSGTDLTFTFIEEVEVKTGGFEAEYGRASGGIVNVITKSGGNDFSGSLVAFFNNYGMCGSGDWRRYRGEDAEWGGNRYMDIGVDVGGYIIKDKLWFFVAYNPSWNQDRWYDVEGNTKEGEWQTDHYAVKFSWNINPNHKLVLSAFGDPKTYQGDKEQVTRVAPDSYYEVDYDYGSHNYVLKYTGIITSNFLIDASIGYRHQIKDEWPLTDAGNQSMEIYYWNDPAEHGYPDYAQPGTRAGGIGIVQNVDLKRTIYDLKFTYFLGGHSLKAGFNYEINNYDQWQSYSGGTYIVFYETDPDYWYDFYVRTRTNIGESETIYNAYFLQDNWAVNDYLNINFGVRYEIQTIRGVTGDDNIKLDNQWAPRLGFSWDVLKDGKSKLYGSYARFYEMIPMDINLRAFGDESDTIDFYKYGPDNIPFTADDEYADTFVYGAADVPVDPDLEGQYLDEYILGYQMEIIPNWAAGIKFIYRDLQKVIEDSAVDVDGSIDYFIVNPGFGTATEYDKPKREYKAIELSLEKKFSDHYQFSFSYVWSKLEGNYDGLYLFGYDQLDPNLTALYDFPEFNINSDGYLFQDRRHRFKLYGAYAFDFGLVVGSILNVRSGRPISALGYDVYHGYGDGMVNTSPKGSEGRTPWTWTWDLHFEYNLKITESIIPTIILDVFNVTNNNETTQVVDEKYTEEFSSYDEDTMTWSDPNPYWKEPSQYQKPRVIRLGFRLTF